MKTLRILGILLVAGTASASAQRPPAGGSEIPAAYRPPKGMCRIWLRNVPPAQQPAPTDCATAVKKVPLNGRVIFGDGAEKEKPKTLPEKSLPERKTEPPKNPPPRRVPPKKPPVLR